MVVVAAAAAAVVEIVLVTAVTVAAEIEPTCSAKPVLFHVLFELQEGKCDRGTPRKP